MYPLYTRCWIVSICCSDVPVLLMYPSRKSPRPTPVYVPLKLIVGRAEFVAYTNIVTRCRSAPNLMVWRSCTQEKLSRSCQIFPDLLLGKLALPVAGIGVFPVPVVPSELRPVMEKRGRPLIFGVSKVPLIPY